MARNRHHQIQNADSRRPEDQRARKVAGTSARPVRHLVMWAADTDRLVDDLLAVDAVLGPVTEAMATIEGVVWATHDLDRESVCFSLMVEGPPRGRDDGLAEARLRARTCLRRCLQEAGLLANTNDRGKVNRGQVRLRLDDAPLRLQRLRATVPFCEGLN